MKIATWNINSVRLRVNLIDKLTIEQQPDIICLQETKTENHSFPVDEIKKIGYEHIIYDGQKSYNGVAILSKYPIKNSFTLEFCNEDKRHICGLINDIEVHNFYVPAGGDEPDPAINPKFKHKLEYIKNMHSWFLNNRIKSDNIVILGDFNIAPHEHDVWSSRQLRNVISHTDIERKILLEFKTAMNFVDTGREFVDLTEKLYSWWSYRSRDWKKSNRGRRLDHIWISKALLTTLKSSNYISEARGWDRPSDHVPYISEFVQD